MSRRKMIGAHVPKRPVSRASRCRLNETAQMVRQAYAEFSRKRQRTHVAYQPPVFGA